MQSARGQWVVAGLLMSGVAACGDGSGGSTFNPQSVPEQKPVNELDETEQAEFCEEAVDWAEDFLGDTLPKLLCRTQAIGEGGTANGFDAAACKAAEQECLSNPPEDELGDGDLTCNFEDLDPSCDVTVGEFADCYDDAASLSKRFLRDITCDSIASGNLPNEADYQLSPSCESVLDRCSGGSSDIDQSESDSGPDDNEMDSGDESGQ